MMGDSGGIHVQHLWHSAAHLVADILGVVDVTNLNDAACGTTELVLGHATNADLLRERERGREREREEMVTREREKESSKVTG